MFYLAPHPKLDRPRRGSPVMFTIPWVDKYFSRVRPWHVVTIWGPFTLYMLWRAGQSMGAGAIAAWAALGAFSWTLLEYLLHRWVFHFKPDPASELQRDASWLIHGIHHDYPWDRDRLVMPPTVTALIAVAVWFGFRWLGAVEHAWFAGLVGGYVWYDLTHYYLHHAAPTTAAGKWLRRYHLVHHFQTPDVRYGITTPLWDFVFGTYPKDRYQRLPDDESRLEAGA
ncbi:MAG TPA: sterol desaturase family protein [Myxococcales bacterium]|nr:sterol desaturase family protein [Myxococcales bacterium]